MELCRKLRVDVELQLHIIFQIFFLDLVFVEHEVGMGVSKLCIFLLSLLVFCVGFVVKILNILQFNARFLCTIVRNEGLQTFADGVNKDGCYERVLIDNLNRDDVCFLSVLQSMQLFKSLSSSPSSFESMMSCEPCPSFEG